MKILYLSNSNHVVTDYILNLMTNLTKLKFLHNKNITDDGIKKKIDLFVKNMCKF